MVRLKVRFRTGTKTQSTDVWISDLKRALVSPTVNTRVGPRGCESQIRHWALQGHRTFVGTMVDPLWRALPTPVQLADIPYQLILKTLWVISPSLCAPVKGKRENPPFPLNSTRRWNLGIVWAFYPAMEYGIPWRRFMCAVHFLCHC